MSQDQRGPTDTRRGRPPRVSGEAASERIWAWLTPSERQRVNSAAEAYGLQTAVLIRLAVLRAIFEPTTSAKDHLRMWQETQAKSMRPASAPDAHALYRARAVGSKIVEVVSLSVLFSRDRAVCGICFKGVKRADATMDHIVPISRGGEHSYRNTQLAHRICNCRKGARLA